MNALDKIKELKEQSGTHSPSIATILSEIPEIKISVDGCFLSNPYATQLFMRHFQKELIETGEIGTVLEYYPPQNRAVSSFISKTIDVASENIFVTNGAIEAIQAVIHRYVNKKLCIILPTFSSYYEFATDNQEVVYYNLKKEDEFTLDVDDYLSFIKANDVDSIVIISPNNPNGGYLSAPDLEKILENTKHLDNVIIDESFIHFAYEDAEMSQLTNQNLVSTYPNIVIIKSMSKDFGIAGIRAGYAIMDSKRVNELLENGYLWNISGLADYFFKLYSNPEFLEEYDIVRKKYIMNTITFINELQKVEGIKVYPSKANFALVEILDGRTSFDMFSSLLINDGIYVRDCSDKIGLDGEFVRVASRTFEENIKIVKAIRNFVSSHQATS